jgi:hypothetical protein
MASIKVNQPKRRRAPSRRAPRSHEKLPSAPPQPAPDIPSPLAELPVEGIEASRARQKITAGSTSIGIDYNLDSSGDASSNSSFAPPSVTGRRGEKKSATRP